MALESTTQHFFSHVGMFSCLPGLNHTKQKKKCLAHGQKHSDSDKSQTNDPSIPSLKLYQLSHCAPTTREVILHGRIKRGRGQPEKSQVIMYVSLEILVQTPLEKQLDPLGPIASRGRSVWHAVKYLDDFKNNVVEMYIYWVKYNIHCSPFEVHSKWTVL